jgi:hypothetical protein
MHHTSPYSLGKLIEWKLWMKVEVIEKVKTQAPYSLGKLIEWKQNKSIY